jgi:flagellar hook-associated protein 3 FlgL
MPVGRVSDQLRYLGLVPRYNSLLSRQIEMQTAIASGQRYQRADEDPLSVALAQRFGEDTSRLDQNIKNIQEAQAFGRVTESSVGTVIEVMQRAMELAVSGGDGSRSTADRANLAAEVDQLLRGVIDQGAATWHGRYIFSGTQTTTPAFASVVNGAGQITGVTYNGNGGDLSTEYTPQETIAYNLLGSNESGGSFGIFRDTGAGVDVFQTLITLRDNLIAAPATMSASVTRISADIQHLTAAEAKLGGIQNRLSFSVLLHEDQKLALTEATSQLIDTDVAAAVTALTSLRVSYEASLNVGARINEVSLLNFLR